jgi:hypothetical protein
MQHTGREDKYLLAKRQFGRPRHRWEDTTKMGLGKRRLMSTVFT